MIAGHPRILVVGYAGVTSRVLEAMYRAGVPPIALLTLPPERAARFSDRGDFGGFAGTRGLPIHAIPHINGPPAREVITSLEPDAALVMGWSQIVSREVIDLFPAGAFGLHPSWLPANRGRAPIPWTILGRERRSAVSFFRLEEEVDAGAVHVQEVFDLGPRETATSLYARVEAGIDAGIPRLLDQIRTGRFEVIESGQPASYNFARRPEDGLIDWKLPAGEIDCLVRATTHPYPGAFTHMREKRSGKLEKLRIWESDLHTPSGRLRSFCALPGQVLGRDPAGATLVQTGDGILVIRKAQREGLPPPPEPELPLAPGDRLGCTLADLLP